jgi:hypothetical protein
MIANSMAYVMTDYYIIFRKPAPYQFLFWTIDHDETASVLMPKHYEDNYMEKVMQFRKDCIALIDKGYSCGKITEVTEEWWRETISDYQQKRNEVWE